MKTKIAGLAVKAAVVTGLAAGLAFGAGFGAADAQQAESSNYFERHAGPVNGRTHVDPYDPYAPLDLTSAGSTSGGAGNARVAVGQSAASDETVVEWSSSPRLPGRPF